MKRIVYVLIFWSFANSVIWTQGLANPDADAVTMRTYGLLQNLHSSGDCLMLGQNLGWSFEQYEETVVALQASTGQWPALIGGQMRWAPDEIRYDDLIALYKEWHQAGGLVELSMLPDNPWTGGDTWDREIGALGELNDPGSAAFQNWRTQLNFYGEILQQLQQEGIPVLFRPLMEMNGDWFWYGYRSTGDQSPEPFIELYRNLYYYYTDSLQLNNLIWIYSVNRSYEGIPSVDYYYPGDDVVDLVGIDLYENGLEMENEQYLQAVALGKPFALTEIGPNHDNMDGSHDYLSFVNKIRTDYPATVYAHAWHSWPEHLVTWIENQRFSEALNLDCVVSRDEFRSQITPTKNTFRTQARVFPNPIAKGSILTISGLEDSIFVGIYDSTGKSIHELKKLNGGEVQLGMPHSGVYTLILQKQNGIDVRKLVVIDHH
ncbi:MAG: T9SS type A sorting domain-containing protein [Saprospiraceae bacterium]|nr:T9SS type A sorting domain-containing protein [Saprospiraceae bacterium]